MIFIPIQRNFEGENLKISENFSKIFFISKAKKTVFMELKQIRNKITINSVLPKKTSIPEESSVKIRLHLNGFLDKKTHIHKKPSIIN